MAADEETLEPDAAWIAMLLAHASAVQKIEADLAAARVIPLNWYDVLLELKRAGEPIRMHVLGRRVVWSRTRVSRLVQELEGRGLVTRSPDPNDGRSTLASITSEGLAALSTAAPFYMAGIEKHFTRHLTASQQRAIATGLTRIAQASDSEQHPDVIGSVAQGD